MVKNLLAKERFDQLAHLIIDGKPEGLYLVIHPVNNEECPVLEEKLGSEYEKVREKGYLFYWTQRASKDELKREHGLYGPDYHKKALMTHPKQSSRSKSKGDTVMINQKEVRAALEKQKISKTITEYAPMVINDYLESLQAKLEELGREIELPTSFILACYSDDPTKRYPGPVATGAFENHMINIFDTVIAKIPDNPESLRQKVESLTEEGYVAMVFDKKGIRKTEQINSSSYFFTLSKYLICFNTSSISGTSIFRLKFVLSSCFILSIAFSSFPIIFPIRLTRSSL